MVTEIKTFSLKRSKLLDGLQPLTMTVSMMTQLIKDCVKAMLDITFVLEEVHLEVSSICSVQTLFSKIFLFINRGTSMLTIWCNYL